jgi:hypothetical protein
VHPPAALRTLGVRVAQGAVVALALEHCCSNCASSDTARSARISRAGDEIAAVASRATPDERSADPRIAQYEDMLRRSHEEAKQFLSRYLSSDNAADYYFLQYPFDGALSMYEAGHSIAWLDWVVISSFELVKRAQSMLDGELGWPWFAADGSPNKLTGDSILCEYQIARPMLRAAKLASTIPGYAHADEAHAIGAFVLDHIMAKWMDRRKGWAGGQRSAELAQDPWFRNVESNPEWESMQEKAARPQHPWLDTWSMAGELYVRAYVLTGVPEYADRARALAALFKRRKQLGPDGAWTWDEGVYVGTWSERGGNTAGSPDTGHANREAAWIVDGYRAGIGFDRSDVDALWSTLDRRIAHGTNQPLFRNYVNGADTPYRGYVFDGSTASTAHVFDGWVRLSWVSRDAEQTFEALLAHRSEGGPNSTVWANLSMPGHLALAAALHGN